MHVFLQQQQLAQLQKEKSEILKNLALYYFTFVDVMEFKVSKSKCIKINLNCIQILPNQVPVKFTFSLVYNEIVAFVVFFL